MGRYFILPLVLASLLGAVFVLPSRGKVAESAVRMTLPQRLGPWQGVKRAESQRERDVLDKGTEFAKADYFRGVPGKLLADGSPDFDRVSVMIVLSGYDINNSIHRPERCLPAQGHFGLRGSDGQVTLSSGRQLPVRRLASQVAVQTGASSEERQVLDSLSYYFFVGHESVTHDHLARTITDMKDRLLFGRDQRWAYVTVSAMFGKLPWSERVVTEQEAEAMVAEITAKLAEETIDWDQMGG